MIKLYYATPSRAIRPRWLLEEIGAPYELVRLDLSVGDQKRPEYLAINPNGTVPALVDGDLKLFESAAICQYLADEFPEKEFAPAVGTPERGIYYQWMHYAMTALDVPVIAILHHTTFRPESERIPAVVEDSQRHLAGALAVLDQALAGKEFILGAKFTAADVMIGSGLVWAWRMRLVPLGREAVLTYVDRLMVRDAFRRASAD